MACTLVGSSLSLSLTVPPSIFLCTLAVFPVNDEFAISFGEQSAASKSDANLVSLL